jgi:hypothetical protein
MKAVLAGTFAAVDWEAGRRHWAFQPLRHAEPPPQVAGFSHPIDRFLEQVYASSRVMYLHITSTI